MGKYIYQIGASSYASAALAIDPSSKDIKFTTEGIKEIPANMRLTLLIE